MELEEIFPNAESICNTLLPIFHALDHKADITNVDRSYSSDHSENHGYNLQEKTLLKFDLQFPLAFLVRLSCCLERKTLKLFPEAESNERPKKLFLPPTS